MLVMSDTPRRWFRFRLRTLLVLTFLAVVGLSVYSYWSDYRDQALRRERELLSPARGAHCAVIFRADLLGLDNMSPAVRTSAEGAYNSIHGTLIMTNDQWIVLASPGDGELQQWIPRENVLLLRVDQP
jgi:hypothetical protein